MLNIALIEPFFTGSHKQWALGLKKYSSHSIEIFSLPGKHWKWRMYGGAIKLAEQYLESGKDFDLILTTDMLDLNLFLSLTRKECAHIPVVLYFHENQLTYPWSSRDKESAAKRDRHYAFINYTSALSADRIIFNSHFHLNSFVDALTPFLSQLPDFKTLNQIPAIKAKSEVLYVGMNFDEIEKIKVQRETNSLNILWNHRWEEDKNPKGFLHFIRQIHHLDFNLILLGERSKSCEVLTLIEFEFSDKIIFNDYCRSRKQYLQWLSKSDIVPVFSNQDFFGISIVEACYCGAIPLLPDRLSYKELLPVELHPQLIYKDGEDLIQKFNSLRSAPISIELILKYLKKFDWPVIVSEYDSMLERTQAKLLLSN